MFLRTLVLGFIFGVAFSTTGILAAPSGGRVTAGDGDLSNPLNLIQQSEHLGTSWESFDIASGEVVNIVQPSASALISIKVRNGVETNINGTLNANGKVALENPAGVLFGAGSVVNVGGLLASASAGAVKANGIIKAPSGEVHLQSLAGNNVVNVGGVIEAQRIIVEGANEVKLGTSDSGMGARLTASKEVLVGGGFQGKGDIANSQKTIVESGALITSPRVIIWSDVSTNFQGSINAHDENGEGGFVEVSGKQSLASFDILKIKAAELLLDPSDISIGQSVVARPDDGELSDGIVEATDSPGGFFRISAAAILSFNGNVRLEATGSITVGGAIQGVVTGRGLTLIAPVIVLNASVKILGDLTLTASDTLRFNFDRAITLSGVNVSLTSGSAQLEGFRGQNLTFTATSTLTLAGGFHSGSANITATGAPINFSTTTPTTLAGRNITLNSTSGTPAASGQTLTLEPSGTLALNGSFNIGAGTLTLSGETFSAQTNLTSFTRADTSLTYTGSGDAAIPSWVATDGAGLTITAAAGNIIVPTSIVLGTGDLTLTAMAGALLFDGDGATIISATNITLTAAQAQATASDQDLTLTATGALTLASSLRLGSGSIIATGLPINFSTTTATTITATNITLTSTSGTPTASDQDLTLTAAGLLVMSGNFNIGEGDAALTFAGDENQTPAPTSLLTDDLTLTHTGTVGIVYTAWMAGAGRNLTLISQNGGIFGLIDINLGDDTDNTIARGDLTLEGVEILARGGGDWTIKAKDISLTATTEAGFLSDGASIKSSSNITLDASGGIMISASHIDFAVEDSRDLTLTAVGEIVFTKDTIIRGRSITLGGTIKAESEDNAGNRVQHNLKIDTSINFANNGSINFAGDKATTISAADITLLSFLKGTASDQALTLTASGTITLGGAFDSGTGAMMMTSGASAPINFSTTLAAALTGGDITLTATGGTATASDQSLTLTSSGTISISGSLNLGAGSLVLGGETFPVSAPAFLANIARGGIGILYTGAGDFTIPSWVIATALGGEDLSVTAPTANIIVPTSIALGTNDLTLTAMAGALLFDGAAATTISAANITLTSTLAQATASGQDLTLTATGLLTMSGRYNIGTGDAALSFSGNSSQAPAPTSLLTDDLTLTQTTANSFFNYASWMAAAGRNLTIIAEGSQVNRLRGINLGNADDSIARGDLTIRAVSINFAANNAFTIKAKDITLTASSTGTEFSAAIWSDQGNLTLDASGNITIGARHIDFALDASLNIIFIAGGEIVFTKDTNILAGNFTLGGTIKAESTNGGITTRHNLSINTNLIGGVTNFATNKATTISGADISLYSFAANTTTDQDLTLDASGTISFSGAFNLGTGRLIFGGETFAAAAPAGLDRVARSGIGILYTGSGDATIPSWIIDVAVAGENLSATAPTGNIIVPTSIALGTSDLTLTAMAGALIFDGAAATTLSATNITLTSTLAQATASDQALNLTATALLTMNGNYDIGTGNASLTFGGTSAQAPAPTSLMTDDLTLTHTGTLGLSYAGWMAGAGRNLTLISQNSVIFNLGDINLGDDTDDNIERGDLTIEANTVGVRDRGTWTIKANNITLTARSEAAGENAGFQSVLGNITLDASGSITISSRHISFFIDTPRDLTLIAGGEILFTKETTILAKNITLGGMVKAQSADASTKYNLSLNIEGKINFATDKATTISGADITLTSPSAGTASDQALTLTASGTITLDGAFDTGTGAMMMTSGASAPINFSTTRATTLTGGNITLNSTGGTPTASDRNLTLEPSGILVLTGSFNTGAGNLMLNGETFSEQTSLTEFTRASTSLTYTGSGDVAIPNWVATDGKDLSVTAPMGNIIVPTSIALGAGDLTLNAMVGALIFDGDGATTLSATNITLTSTLAQATASNQALNLTASGVLAMNGNYDIGTGDASLMFGGGQNQNPAPTSLLTDDLTLTYTGTGGLFYVGSWMAGVGRNLTLISQNADIFRLADINLGDDTDDNITRGDLTIEGNTISVDGDDTWIIKAKDIILTARSEGASDDAGIQSASGSLTLDATGNITISSRHIDFMTDTFGQDLTLIAGGEIVFAKDTNISGLNVTLGGTIKVESVDGDGNKVKHNLNIRNGSEPNGKTHFATDKATTISAADITLNSTTKGTASNQALTLTATGTITLSGAFDTGTGAITMTSGTSAPINFSTARATTLTGGNITLTSTGGTPTASNRALTLRLTSSSELTLSGSFSIGTSTLTLESGSFPAPASLNEFTYGNVVLTHTGSGDLIIPSWVIADGKDLSITATTGNIAVPTSIALGTADLTINAMAGALLFDGGAATTLSAANITLGSAVAQATASDQALNLTTTALLTMSGNYDIGTGNAALMFAGDHTQAPAPTSLLTDDLTLTHTGTGSLHYVAWMAGAGRNLRLISTSGNIIIFTGINLGDDTDANITRGNLILKGGSIAVDGSGTFTVKANNINLTARSNLAGEDGAGFQSTIGNLTLDATGNITISSRHIDFFIGDAPQDLTLIAGGEILFTKDTDIIANNITLGGTIKVDSNPDPKVNTWEDLKIEAKGRINFATDKATIIRARGITLISPSAGTASNQNLTIDPTSGFGGGAVLGGHFNTGTGDILVENGVELLRFSTERETSFTGGNITIESRSGTPTASNRNLTLTASGTISFSGPFNLGTGSLTLEAESFPANAPAGLDGITRNRLTLIYTGDDDFTIPSWIIADGEDLSVRATTANIVVPTSIALGDGDLIINAVAGAIHFDGSAATIISAANITLTSTLAQATASDQALNLTATGALTMSGNYNFGTGDVSLMFAGTTAQTPAPASLLTDDLTLTHTGTGSLNYAAWMAGEGRNLTLISQNGGVFNLTNINLGNADDDITRGDLNISGVNISPSNGGTYRIKARNIILTATSESDFTTETAAIGADGGSLVLDASEDITISASYIDFFLGDDPEDLTLIAGGQILFTKDTNIRGRNLTLGGVVNVQSADASIKYNLLLDARGRLNFATDKATTITTADITLLSPSKGAASDQALTLTASGTITLGGTFDTGSGDIMMTSGASAPINFSTARTTTLTAGNITLASTGGTPTASDRNLTLKPSGTISFSGAFNLGTGSLTLEAESFPANAPTGLDGITRNRLTLIYSGADDFTIPSWIMVAGEDLSVRATTANIIVPTATPAVRDIILIAQAGALLFDGAAATTLSATNITLTSTLAQATASEPAPNQALNLTASGVLAMNGNYNFGTGDVSLTFAGTTTQNPAPDELLTDDLTLTYTGTGGLDYAAWMEGAGRNLTLIAETGIVTLAGINLGNADDDITRGNLTIRAAVIASSQGRDLYTIKANNITLTATSEDNFTEESPGPGLQFASDGITFNASGNITISASYIFIHDGDSTDTDLTLIAGGEIIFTKDTNISVRNITLGGVIKVGLVDGDGNITERKDLNINASDELDAKLSFASDKATTITAADITLSTRTKGATSNQDLTLDASGVLTMTGSYDLGTGNAALTFAGDRAQNPAPTSLLTDDLTLTHTGTEGLTFAAWMVSEGRNLTLTSQSGDINNVGGTIAGNNITLTAGGTIDFATDTPTIIRGAAVSLTSSTAQVRASGEGQDLTIEATGNITLEGGFDLETGALRLTAGINAGTGAIIFTEGASGKPTITAATATLTQSAAVFELSNTAPATFTLSVIAKPRVRYIGTDLTQLMPSDAGNWFELLVLTYNANANDINIMELIANDSAIAGGAFAGFSIESGVLDFGSQIIQFITTGAIIFPEGITEIRAEGLTLTAASIATDGTTTTNFADLSINVASGLFLSVGSLTSTGTLTLEGINLVVVGDTILNANAITIIMTGTGTEANATIRNIDNQSLTLNATGGDITLTAANIDLRHADTGAGAGTGEGNLTLSATGDILFPQETTINANNLTLGGMVKAQSADASIKYNLSLIARAQIIFAADKATTISGADITLASPAAQTTASEQNLTLIASGVLTMSGNYNIGTGSTSTAVVMLTFAGGNTQAPAPTTLLTNNLTLTYTSSLSGDNYLNYAAWMAGAGRNLTLSAGSSVIRNIGNINLANADDSARGNLALTAIAIIGADADENADPFVIKANDINITATSRNGDPNNAGFRSGGSMVLDASNDINILARFINFNAVGGEDDLTLISGNDSIVIRPTSGHAPTVMARNLTLGGMVRIGGASLNSFTLTLTGALSFAADKDTTLRAFNITITSTTAGTASNRNLTLIASRNITLQGIFNLATADGASDFTATANEDITLQGVFNFGNGRFLPYTGNGNTFGEIIFVETTTDTGSVKPIITAGYVLLSQDEKVFALSTTAPATFRRPSGAPLIPEVACRGPRCDGGLQPTPTDPNNWFRLEGTSASLVFSAGGDDITIADLIADDSPLAKGSFASLTITEEGLLDFGMMDVELITTGSIIFPAGIREIRAGSLILFAAAIMTDDSSGNFIADLKIDVAGVLALSAPTLTTSGALTLEGGSLLFTGNLALNATEITITMTSTGTAATAAIRNSDNQSLTLTASAGNITLTAANIDLRHANSGAGEGSLTLSASGEILFTQAADVKANNITLGGVVKAESTDEADPPVTTQHNLSLVALGQITFTGATTISGADITLASPTAQTTASDADLTITATGVLAMSGDYNIGEGNAALTFAGDAAQNPAPTSLLTDDLTLTHTGIQGLGYAMWMAGAGRNLTLISENGQIFSLADINLGNVDDSIPRGNLTIRGSVIGARSGNFYTITANNITLTATSENNFTEEDPGPGIQFTNEGITFNASGNITISASYIFLDSGAGTDRDLTLIAGGEIIFTKETNIDGRNITFGGTIKVESTSEGTATQHNLLLTATGQINFATDKDTTITGANISLISATAGDTSNQNLTITAGGNLTLQGSFDVGDDATTGGTMTLTAGAGDGVGTIIFTSSPTLTAKAITLAQDGARFDPATSPANFVIANSGKPQVRYSGGETQAEPADDDWFELARLIFDAGASDITITTLLTMSDFTDATFDPVSGLLNFGDELVALTTTGNIIFPASVREIRAGSLTLTAATITTDDSSGNFIADLKIDVDGVLALPALTLTATGALTLEGAALDIVGSLILNATEITITMTGTGTGATAAIHNTDNQSLTLNATSGNITITAANIDLRHANPDLDGNGTGEGNLTLSASGEILFLQAETDIQANNITLGGVVKAESDSPARRHLLLVALRQITFALNKPTTITGANITLASPIVQTTATDQAFTITATDMLTMSGNYNFGSGNVALTFAGALQSTPPASLAPDSLLTDDLTLTYNPKVTVHGLKYAAWMAAAGRNLTIITKESFVFGLADINLGNADDSIARGNLTIEAVHIIYAAGTHTITANNISLTGTSENDFTDEGHTNSSGIGSSVGIEGTTPPEGGVTLDASGNITISARYINFLVSNNRQDLTFIAGGEIAFTKETNIRAKNLTLGGVVKAESADGSSKYNLTLEAEGQIIFASDKATAISGASLTLTSPTAGTASGQDLTLTASGDITLAGGFDIGNGGGTLALTAGAGEGTGTIIFTGTPTPTLTARAITLTQDGAVFPFAVPAVTFQIGVAGDGLPRIRYTGGGTQEAVDGWARQQGVFSSGDIILDDEFAATPDDEGVIMIDLTENQNEDEKDFIINSDEDLILPDGEVMIVADVISITAKSVRRQNGEGIRQRLMLVATQTVIIDASIISTADIIITAPQVIFSGTKPVRLSGTNIMIDLPDGMDMPSAMPAGNNQNVELSASGDIMLNNNINVGFGTLKLEARGEIMTTSADVVIMGNRVVYQAGSIGGGLAIISMNDIRLLGDIQTDGNVVLRAGGSIITPAAATTIEATGADNGITFEQRYAFRQGFDLTLKAAGEISIIGGLDRGSAVITLDGGVLDLAQASLSAGEIACRPIPVGLGGGVCR